jgi:hypothetical protein
MARPGDSTADRLATYDGTADGSPRKDRAADHLVAYDRTADRFVT